MDGILWCNHSNETSFSSFLHGAIYLSTLYKKNLGFFLESLYLALFKLDNMVSFLITRKVLDRFVLLSFRWQTKYEQLWQKIEPFKVSYRIFHAHDSSLIDINQEGTTKS